MAATQFAKIGTFQSYATSAPFIASAFTDNASGADLLQIVAQNGKTVLAVQQNGTVNFNASGLTATPGSSAGGSYTSTAGGVGRALIGVFFALAGYPVDTAAHAIAAAFPTNPEAWDIIQVVAPGQSVGYWLDSNGVAHGS